MEAAEEELFDFGPFKGDGLEDSFIIVVEERQSFSSICRKKNTLHVKRCKIKHKTVNNNNNKIHSFVLPCYDGEDRAKLINIIIIEKLL